MAAGKPGYWGPRLLLVEEQNSSSCQAALRDGSRGRSWESRRPPQFFVRRLVVSGRSEGGAGLQDQGSKMTLQGHGLGGERGARVLGTVACDCAGSFSEQAQRTLGPPLSAEMAGGASEASRRSVHCKRPWRTGSKSWHARNDEAQSKGTRFCPHSLVLRE